MKPFNGIVQDGKLTVRKNEDRGKRERLMHKDKSLARAYICLHCDKPKCSGEEKCFAGEEKKHGQSDGGAAVVG